MTYATAELEPTTWQDFERLFAPGTGWAFCACMLYQRGCHLHPGEYPTRDVARIENLRQKRELVETGRVHGVLVYDDDEPIGWCQYGPVEELPLPGSTRLDRRIPPLAPDVDWRITCFVTAVGHRGRGVARAALDGALAAIGRRGAASWRRTRRQRPRTATGRMQAAWRCSNGPASPYISAQAIRT